MKLLLDQNLPRSLLPVLVQQFPDSKHVSDLSLQRASDETVWTRARIEGFELVTRDSDFLDIAELRGVPPKILLRIGNVSVDQLIAIFLPLLPLLPNLLRDSALGVVIEGGAKIPGSF